MSSTILQAPGNPQVDGDAFAEPEEAKNPFLVALGERARELSIELIDGFKRLGAARSLGDITFLLARVMEADDSVAKAAMYGLNRASGRTSELEEAWIVFALVRSGVDDAMLRAIAHAESRFDEKAVSPKGAQGVMQLMPATARETARRHGIPVDEALAHAAQPTPCGVSVKLKAFAVILKHQVQVGVDDHRCGRRLSRARQAEPRSGVRPLGASAPHWQTARPSSCAGRRSLPRRCAG